MISLTKAIGAIFGLLMAYSTFLNYKRKEFTRAQFYFWEIIWIGMLSSVFFTAWETKMVESIGFIRMMDFLTVAGFIIVIALSFHNYSSINKNRRQIEAISRHQALNGIKEYENTVSKSTL